jgi:ATP-dependent DNA helicase RecG
MNDQRPSALELIRQLNETDEHARIEAKACRSEIGKSAMQTVCALSNEPGLGGGYILLGVSREQDTLFPQYEATGVQDSDKVQSDFATQCASMFSVAIRPQLTVELLKKKRVIVAFVPEAPAADKPVYLVKDGLPGGAFRRVGASDVRCTAEDLALLFQERQTEPADQQPISDATMDDIDPDTIVAYRRMRSATSSKKPADLELDDTDLLIALRCLRKSGSQLVPTVAGLLLFGKATAIRRCFPMVRVDYIRTGGTEWMENGGDDFSAVEIVAPLVTAIFRTNAAILDDIPKAFNLPAGQLRRKEMPVIPERVVREAVVNAAMHRSYRVNSPIQIIRYSNRIEMRNPGYSLKSDELFGQPGSNPRNPTIAAILHEIQLAETKGIGLRIMNNSMRDAGLPPPYLESDRDANQFVAIFAFHHLLSEPDVQWLARFKDLGLSPHECQALVFARETRAINNAAYRNMSGDDTLTASHHLRRLRGLGLLEKRNKGTATYYVPTEQLLRDESPKAKREKHLGKPQELNLKPQESTLPDPEDDIGALPEKLQKMVDRLAAKAGKVAMWRTILRLCEWRDLRASQLGELCGKNGEYIRARYIADLLDNDFLQLTAPPRSPKVRYKTSPKGKAWLKRGK